MGAVLVDSNILLDIATNDPAWGDRTGRPKPGRSWRCRGGCCCRPGPRPSVAASEGHDLIGGESDAPTGRTQPLDRRCSPGRPLARRGLDDPDVVAFDDELDVGVRQKPGPFPDNLRDRHLTLRCDPHRRLPLHSYRTQ